MQVQEEQKYTKPVSTQPKALQVLATIASYVFHPVFMPVVMTLALFRLAPVAFAGVGAQQMNIWTAMTALNTILFPLLTVGLLKALGFIQSVHMYNPKDRIIPLIGTMIFYFWAYQVIKNQHAPLILQTLSLGCFWGIIALFMVSIFFKISMHTTAAGGMLGIIIVQMIISPVNMKVPFFVALVIAGIIGTSRLILNAHKQSEIWLGYILGIISMIGAYIYLI